MIKCYAKTLLLSWLLFLLVLLTPTFIGIAPDTSLTGAAGEALVYGAVLAAILGTAQIISARRAAGQDTAGDIYSVSQTRTLESGLPRERLFAAAELYLKQYGRSRVTLRDADAGRLEALTPLNLLTLGSRIAVTISDAEDGRSRVRIDSKPLLLTLPADFGANLKIARGIEAHLRAGGH
ncbi:MAG TPA: hypothetical protein DCW72_02140 [Elusimicrobia bacterium]|nr:MAG: hypothetical protein A2X29_01080 [Elusimicrobia bacterium GWA2_64_40]OGR66800.1 MAG: hypothetical protein A2X30_11990 [Elusimicrobia bacterium GWB2_63_16]HAN04013.1 hypothetical protein [Elusimicrobiota bacterium]HAU89055.1 hypothetical protein [Elusimicrobiota bacterium]